MHIGLLHSFCTQDSTLEWTQMLWLVSLWVKISTVYHFLWLQTMPSSTGILWMKQEHLLCHLLKHMIKLEQSKQWGPWRRPRNKKESLETDQVYTQIFYIRYMDEEWVITPVIPEHLGYLSKLALHLKCIHSKRISYIHFWNTKRTRKSITLDKCTFQVGKAFVKSDTKSGAAKEFTHRFIWPPRQVYIEYTQKRDEQN